MSTDKFQIGMDLAKPGSDRSVKVVHFWDNPNEYREIKAECLICGQTTLFHAEKNGQVVEDWHDSCSCSTSPQAE